MDARQGHSGMTECMDARQRHSGMTEQRRCPTNLSPKFSVGEAFGHDKKKVIPAKAGIQKEIVRTVA